MEESKFLINHLEGVITCRRKSYRQILSHPNVRSIQENIKINYFATSYWNVKIDPKKKGMLSSISWNMWRLPKHVVAGDLCTIWNKEIKTHGYFVNRLKLTPLQYIKNWKEIWKQVTEMWVSCASSVKSHWHVLRFMSDSKFIFLSIYMYDYVTIFIGFIRSKIHT